MTFEAINIYQPSGISHVWRDSRLPGGQMWALCGYEAAIGDLDPDPKSALRKCKKCQVYATLEYNKEAEPGSASGERRP